MASNDSESDVIEFTSEDEDDTRMIRQGPKKYYDSEDEGYLVCKRLELALQEDKLELPGSYAHSSLLPIAPYPCLNIESLGKVGLPLTETDAKRVIACASQAPFGQGNQTIVNKHVRDTWEIEPARVKFENPNWHTYVQDLAAQTVCPALGVKNYDTPPRCQFYKLLIYETGSRFLPHRDTQKEDNMFATMIVLLPSEYTGGEIHVTHASKTQIIDFSSSSSANTAVLAWYTDVLHEVKPVTSGYRLALSYNLIHTSSRVPLPMAPTDDGPCGKLRKVLRNWKMGKYEESEESEESEECGYIAYLLKHKYSEVDFRRGVSCLKGEDEERVALVRAAAEGLEFPILLANMEYHFHGWSEDDDDRRHGYSMHGFDEVDVSISLSKMIDLDGKIVFGSGKRSVNIDKGCFLPRDALDDERPDNSDESGYTGNEGATVEYWYHRSVFVLMLPDQLPRILIRNGGIGHVMKQFKESLSENTPTIEDRTLAKQIISNLHYAGDNKVSVIKTMFDYAYEWKDIEMWQDLVMLNGIKVQGENGLVQAWGVFKFDQTRASVEGLLRMKRLPDKFTFINAIRQAASESDEKDVVQKWCSKQVSAALKSYVSPDLSDVPFLVSRACKKGIQGIYQIPIKKIVPDKAFQFLTELIRALHPQQAAVLEKTMARYSGNNDPQSEASRMLDEFISNCLDCAGRQWNTVIAEPQTTTWYDQTQVNYSNQQRVQVVLKIVKLCLLTHQMDTCRTFLDRVWNVSGVVVDKFNKIYVPLVPELCKLLQKTNTDVCAPPFIDFLRLLISNYLGCVLGGKGQIIQPVLRKIGCGCGDCQELDRFLAGTRSQHIFCIAQARRSHLEDRMYSAQDLVRHETHRVGSPHSLVVTKDPAIVAASTWEHRIQVANKMLEAIGRENIEKIMGDRYVDVCKAMKGKAAFDLDEMVVQQPEQNAPGPSTAKPTTSVIGGKRKRG